MDFGTIEKRLAKSYYKSIWQLDSDVRLIWKNATLFNRTESRIYMSAVHLGKSW